MQKISALLIGLTVFFVPVSASAQSVSDLQQQAEALLQKVAQLQAQLGTAQTTTGQTVAPGNSCPKIGRTLRMGASGADVSNLQAFLALDRTVYPEGIVSGYYGGLTQAAVERWQAKYNIVSSGSPATTGFGVVGPRTAAAIALLCARGTTPTNSPVGGVIQVSPIAGNSPLAVTVNATVNTTKSCTGATYLLDFGDGSAILQIPVQSGNCEQLSQTFQHTYTYGGTYQVRLSAGTHTTTATLTVYGPSAPPPAPAPTPTPTPPPSTGGSFGIISITPNVSGNPLSASVQISLPLSCPAHSVNWGDGGAASSGSCQAGANYATETDSHTYTQGGNYTISLKDGSGVVQATGSITISN
jgi:peptidoglycan hydrolase-like protein with peptidoglycan-binding domain